jgi:allophanate hydrolase
MNSTQSFSIGVLRRAYRDGELDPADVIAEVYRRIARAAAQPVFTELVPEERARLDLAEARERVRGGSKLPLFGVPFAVKDNIDVSGVPTTAACPAFAYTPTRSATAVARLIDAGAILVGKTNMDQFATGLVGTRTPYGACASVFDPRYISGGSSSGSAVCVAEGQVSFALGTDTAGSGRVPAAFNHVVGLKPTRGLVSTLGVVPACRSLDCVSVFAASVPDAVSVLSVMGGFDAEDPFSRRDAVRPSQTIARVGIPAALEFFGNAEYARLYALAAARLAELGVESRPVEIEALLEAQKLLYGGPWIAERYAGVGPFIEAHRSEVNEVVRDIILSGRDVPAHEAFRGRYRLAELARRVEATFEDVDAILLPTAGTHYTHAEIASEPLTLNANLGRYTNFVNLLDLAALAIPAGFTRDGLPFGVTLIGPAGSDRDLAVLGERMHRALEPTFGAARTPLAAPELAGTAQRGEVLLAVCGAHLRGGALNHQLTSRGARFVVATKTAPDYRFYALKGTVPPKPGLVHAPGFTGPGIEVEVFALSDAAFGSFVAEVPAPMVIGTARLADGSLVKSFLCEPFALDGSEEITAFGGFRAYLARAKS